MFKLSQCGDGDDVYTHDEKTNEIRESSDQLKINRNASSNIDVINLTKTNGDQERDGKSSNTQIREAESPVTRGNTTYDGKDRVAQEAEKKSKASGSESARKRDSPSFENIK